MLHTCVFLVSSLSFYMNLIVQKTVTRIFTKCLLRTKQFLSRQHSHLASMLCAAADSLECYSVGHKPSIGHC